MRAPEIALAVALLVPASAPRALAEERARVTFLLPESERESEGVLRSAVDAGQRRVETWFSRPYPKPYVVEVLSSRSELDAALSRHWETATTACGFVAAGIGDRLIVLSPRVWKTESCVKDVSPAHVDDVIAHELVHVFHGQVLAKGDFHDMDEMAWFVEGLATLVSGQLDAAHAGEARAALKAGKGPKTLQEAWSGRYKIGVSGSLVRFIETTFGRKVFDRLLPLGRNAALMATLRTNEGAFLADWRREIRKTPKR